MSDAEAPAVTAEDAAVAAEEAAALLGKGSAVYHTGDLDRAETLFRAAEEAASSAGDALLSARALSNVAAVLLEKGQEDTAVPLLTQCYELLYGLRQFKLAGRVAHNLVRGAAALARRYAALEEECAAEAEAEEQESQVEELLQRGEQLYKRDAAQAVAAFEEAVALAESSEGDTSLLCLALLRWALAAKVADVDRTERLLLRVDTVASGAGLQGPLAVALQELYLLSKERERWDEAGALLERRRELAEQSEEKEDGLLEALEEEKTAFLALREEKEEVLEGDALAERQATEERLSAAIVSASKLFKSAPSDALAQFTEAAEEAEAAGLELLQARALGNKATCFVSAKQPAEAVPLYGKAIDIFLRLGEPDKADSLLKNLAVALNRLKRYDEADAAFRRRLELAGDDDKRRATVQRRWDKARSNRK